MLEGGEVGGLSCHVGGRGGWKVVMSRWRTIRLEGCHVMLETMMLEDGHMMLKDRHMRVKARSLTKLKSDVMLEALGENVGSAS